ncbi:MAG: hypothetical protein VZR53_12605, partial [Prevotella sp.]|nr:hypothetical protein [Prevotella sp.]
LYNRHGELDRVCGMQFPSCESMDVVGDRYSRYSTAFIAAMEDEKEGLWAKFKKMVAKIWNWIKNVASKIWEKIKALFGFKKKRWQKIVDFLKRNRSKIAIGVGAIAVMIAGAKWIQSTRFYQRAKIGMHAGKIAIAIKKIQQMPDGPLKDAEIKALMEEANYLDYLTMYNDTKLSQIMRKGDNRLKKIMPIYTADEFIGQIQLFMTERAKFDSGSDYDIQQLTQAMAVIYSFSNTIEGEKNPFVGDLVKAIRKTNKNIPKLYAQLLSLQRKGDKIDKHLADTIRKDMSKFTTVLVNNRTNINEHILPAIDKSRADNNITRFDDDLYRIAMTSS